MKKVGVDCTLNLSTCAFADAFDAVEQHPDLIARQALKDLLGEALLAWQWQAREVSVFR
jgi:hypothetical protein